MSRLREEYSVGQWEVPSDFMTYEHFARVVAGIDMTSSPGYPYCLSSATNKDYFQAKDGVVPPHKMMEVWVTVQNQIRERKADPIRLFIKPEPHSRAKLEAGRYRLISSVSIIDQIIDAMLFAPMNDRLLWQPLHNPCKGGWSPYVGGWKVAPMSGAMSLDKSAWDWSVQGWLFEMELQLRMDLCKTPNAVWNELATWRYKSLFGCPTFITSGGLMLQQKSPGVMKSGCFNTLVTNSIMQSIVHHRACQESDIEPGWLWSLGDDTLQQLLTGSDREAYMAALSQYCHVKHCVDGVEFAGMKFDLEGVHPLYPAKHAFQLLHMDPKIKKDMAVSYDLLYHRSRDSSYMKKLLSTFAALRPAVENDIIWDGLE